jgi:hypothetical protein
VGEVCTVSVSCKWFGGMTRDKRGSQAWHGSYVEAGTVGEVQGRQERQIIRRSDRWMWVMMRWWYRLTATLILPALSRTTSDR